MIDQLNVTLLRFATASTGTSTSSSVSAVHGPKGYKLLISG